MASGVRTHLHVEAAGTAPDALDGFERLRSAPFPWLLDSALADGRLGRFSFAGADPWGVLRARGPRLELDVRRAVRPDWPVGRHAWIGDPFEALRGLCPRVDAAPASARAIPFVGGAVGYFGYELVEQLESVAFPANGPAAFPDLLFLLVDAALAVEHATGRVFQCGLGFGSGAEQKARERVSRLRGAGRTVVEPALPSPRCLRPVRSRHDAESYGALVDTVKDAIAEGDLYQACLTQRLSVPFEGDPWQLYRRLRAGNPAPFAAYLELPEGVVLSSSPERFLHVDGEGAVEARPIKGTRAFGPGLVGAEASARALAGSEKDRAENLMIVDLYRNDLGRVCATGSVRVSELFAIERYATLHQMVSTVTGRLAPGRDRLDLVRAAFPPGSMTGAPKIAAMRLLAGLEADRRGVYAGALGYLDVRGGMDLSVVIRTILVSDGEARVHVGGGIVADSQPRSEYQESMDKARALLAALGAGNAPEGSGRRPPSGGAAACNRGKDRRVPQAFP